MRVLEDKLNFFSNVDIKYIKTRYFEKPCFPLLPFLLIKLNFDTIQNKVYVSALVVSKSD